ncbi:MAG: hypothetical protein R3F65_28545 [bacterium]
MRLLVNSSTRLPAVGASPVSRDASVTTCPAVPSPSSTGGGTRPANSPRAVGRCRRAARRMLGEANIRYSAAPTTGNVMMVNSHASVVETPLFRRIARAAA